MRVNAKAFRAHRELRIMFAAWNLRVLCRLRPTLEDHKSLLLINSVVQNSSRHLDSNKFTTP